MIELAGGLDGRGPSGTSRIPCQPLNPIDVLRYVDGGWSWMWRSELCRHLPVPVVRQPCCNPNLMRSRYEIRTTGCALVMLWRPCSSWPAAAARGGDADADPGQRGAPATADARLSPAKPTSSPLATPDRTAQFRADDPAAGSRRPQMAEVDKPDVRRVSLYIKNQTPAAMGIASGGTAIYAEPGGRALATVPVGGVLTVTGKSADGDWYAVYNEDAVFGWAPAGQLRVYRRRRR